MIGLSILSGSHLDLVPDVIARLAGVGVDVPVVVGGIIPEEDRPRLIEAGVARVYTPADFDLTRHRARDRRAGGRPSRRGGRRLRAAATLATALWASLAGCGDDGNQSATTAAPSSSEATAPVGFELEDVVLTGADGEQHDVAVWVADTAEERGRGLMGVTDLGAAVGMLFVFDAEGLPQFYMWQTPMPLDIAFFAADGTFVDSASMEPCLQPPSDACTRYASAEPYLLALELPSGGLTELDLAAGASLTRR